MTKRIKSTKGQRKELLGLHAGVGFMVYKSGEGRTVELEFFISNKDGKPHYIGNGAEVTFEIDRSEES